MLEKDMSKILVIQKGNHRLNGKELLGYARFRHDPEGYFTCDVTISECKH